VCVRMRAPVVRIAAVSSRGGRIYCDREKNLLISRERDAIHARHPRTTSNAYATLTLCDAKLMLHMDLHHTLPQTVCRRPILAS